MKRKIQLFTFLFLVQYAVSVAADSGPMEFYIPGNIGQKKSTNVAMIKEIVTFKQFSKGYRSVNVTAEFWFQNQGGTIGTIGDSVY